MRAKPRQGNCSPHSVSYDVVHSATCQCFRNSSLVPNSVSVVGKCSLGAPPHPRDADIRAGVMGRGLFLQIACFSWGVSAALVDVAARSKVRRRFVPALPSLCRRVAADVPSRSVA